MARLRAGIADNVPEIVAKLVEQALRGDVASARLLLERTIAPLRPTDMAEPVPLAGDTLAEQGRAVLAAVSEGRLAPNQGAALLESLSTMAKLIESDELLRRVAALEETHERRSESQD